MPIWYYFTERHRNLRLLRVFQLCFSESFSHRSFLRVPHVFQLPVFVKEKHQHNSFGLSLRQQSGAVLTFISFPFPALLSEVVLLSPDKSSSNSILSSALHIPRPVLKFTIVPRARNVHHVLPSDSVTQETKSCIYLKTQPTLKDTSCTPHSPSTKRTLYHPVTIPQNNVFPSMGSRDSP